MRGIPISVFILTAALLVNVLLAVFEGPSWAVITMFVTGPFLMVWMVLHVLRDDSVRIRDLRDDEWGYQDRPDLRPARE